MHLTLFRSLWARYKAFSRRKCLESALFYRASLVVALVLSAPYVFIWMTPFS